MNDSKAKVLYKDVLAGEIFQNPEGDFYFSYTPDYLNSDHPPISYSLPKTKAPFLSRSLLGFFDGLLPEDWLLDLAGKIYKLNPFADRYELLLQTCVDPIGAVSIISKDTNLNLKKKDLPQKKQTLINKYNKCLFCYEPIKEHTHHQACAKKIFGSENIPQINLTTALLDEIEKHNINSKISITGAQHKISLDLEKNQKESRLTITNYAGNYILKPKGPKPHLPENEHLMLKLAQIFGIKTCSSSLVLLENGDLAFLSKRFDRLDNGSKIHMEDFGQILDQLSSKKYISSIEKVSRALRKYSRNNAPQDQVLKLFELVVFSYLIGNSDLHLKNISVLLDPLPRLAPAYDLLSFEIYQEDFQDYDPEESALAINGKKAKLNLEDFNHLASSLSIHEKVRNYIYKKTQVSQNPFFKLIDKSFLPLNKQILLKNLIVQRSDLLNSP